MHLMSLQFLSFLKLSLYQMWPVGASSVWLTNGLPHEPIGLWYLLYYTVGVSRLVSYISWSGQQPGRWDSSCCHAHHSFLYFSLFSWLYLRDALPLSFVVGVVRGFFYLGALFLCWTLGRNKSFAAFIMAVFTSDLTVWYRDTLNNMKI